MTLALQVHPVSSRGGSRAGGASVVNALILDGSSVQVRDAAGRVIPSDRWLGARSVRIRLVHGRTTAAYLGELKTRLALGSVLDQARLLEIDAVGVIIRRFLLQGVRPLKFRGPELPAGGNDVEMEEIEIDVDSMEMGSDDDSDGRDRGRP
ncbi:MAG: hypothetical protein R3E12_02715 [Candidatus Eisenbacteria bacterium]|uniref:Uncharacterized protein n=1 Tax=Eiseniibacteriota bacterium TaxID=2212470 RepID=A0A956RNW9_UNCEI|nr:hypothetical protein [Candidatus Eisenbacteria bacterium]